MTNKKNIIILIILVLLFSGCEGVATLFHGPKPEKVREIYAAGYSTLENGVTVATVWKNGIPIYIDQPSTMATSIVIKDSDIYMGGSVINYRPNRREFAQLWKNGISISTELTFPPDPNQYLDGIINGVAIHGNDLYAVGTIGNIIYIWKNGKYTRITYGSARGVIVKGSDVYVLADSGFSVSVWKNNSTAWSISNSTESVKVVANAFVIDGSVIYVAGIQGGMAKVWRNYIARTLAFDTSSANAIAVVGSDVYVAGSEGNIAKVWKNDVGINLTDGTFDAQANAIAVVGSDVYIAGYEKNSNGVEVAKIWINGVETALSDGYANARANAIAIQN